MKKITILALFALLGFTSRAQSCNFTQEITTADSILCIGDSVSLSFLVSFPSLADTIISTPIVNNNGQDGNMFDVTASNTIRIRYFEGNIANIPNPTTNYSIYYKQGSHVGFETNSAAWTLIADSIIFNPNAPNALSVIPYNVNIVIPAGETYAFYLTNLSSVSNNNRYHSGTATGTIAASNTDLTVYEGTGGAYPFGTFFNARPWEGTIHYDLPEVSYLWNTGDTTSSIEVAPFSTTEYSCELNVLGMNCSVEDTITIEVNALPLINLSDLTELCAGDSALLDAGNPGATYLWSTSDSSQVIAASVNGMIAVAVTDANGCVGVDTTLIVVNPLPVVTSSAMGDVCANSEIITLNQGSPAGGSYSGTAVSGSDFDPALAGVGVHVLMYDYTDTNGCVASDTTLIVVNPLPVVTFSAIGDVCADSEVITLSHGSPAGGAYSGTAVSGSDFDPALAGTGVHVLMYDYTDTNGCASADTSTIVINSLPTVEFSDLQDLCVYNNAVVLSQGSPAGGSYIGTGVSGGNFDPAVAGTGTHVVTYEYTDGNGCLNSDTSEVFVDDCLSLEEHAVTFLTISPNPFVQSTRITLDQSVELGQVLFEVYDMTGKKVMILKPADYTFEFSRGNLESGMYQYELTSQGKSLKSGKLIAE
jgi:hypothetical protein